MIPDRWAREFGAALCYAALYCAVRAAPAAQLVGASVLIFAVVVASWRAGVRFWSSR